jgi:hypothetical protein
MRRARWRLRQRIASRVVLPSARLRATGAGDLTNGLGPPSVADAGLCEQLRRNMSDKLGDLGLELRLFRGSAPSRPRPCPTSRSHQLNVDRSLRYAAVRPESARGTPDAAYSTTPPSPATSSPRLPAECSAIDVDALGRAPEVFRR